MMRFFVAFDRENKRRVLDSFTEKIRVNLHTNARAFITKDEYETIAQISRER